MRKYKKTVLILLLSSSLLLFFFSLLLPSESTGQFLLMQPIENAIGTGNFTQFKEISAKKISVNLESPFNLRGYIAIAKFIEDFTGEYSPYKAEKIEWSSKQIDGNYAVQSLNVILKNKRSRQEIYYKFIFFMKRNVQWEIYYLRGLVF
ncbi:MAG TPA: hypothetical protein VK469_22580 [Candidatus Kapabacteria bacterium]|nr:hypothetical protein [Candidatus Kapabacteria bacterium]